MYLIPVIGAPDQYLRGDHGRGRKRRMDEHTIRVDQGCGTRHWLSDHLQPRNRAYTQSCLHSIASLLMSRAVNYRGLRQGYIV
jgi:hypothetical protein